MKRLHQILTCISKQIKNFFSSSPKTDIYQDCQKAINLEENIDLENEKLQSEEYLKNYNSTTRWQTV